MLGNELLKQVRKLAEDVSTREGCALWDVEFVGAKGGRTLRVYIDKLGEAQVSIDDCSNVSRGLNLLLDVEDIIPGGNYNLEVSSPGVERVLKEKWHFEKVVGQTINFKTFASLGQYNESRLDLEKIKYGQGPLKSVSETGIQVQLGEAEVYVPYDQITKAHVVFVFEEPASKKDSHKKKKK